jgi:hypothetical protein
MAGRSPSSACRKTTARRSCDERAIDHAESKQGAARAVAGPYAECAGPPWGSGGRVKRSRPHKCRQQQGGHGHDPSVVSGATRHCGGSPSPWSGPFR